MQLSYRWSNRAEDASPPPSFAAQPIQSMFPKDLLFRESPWWKCTSESIFWALQFCARNLINHLPTGLNTPLYSDQNSQFTIVSTMDASGFWKLSRVRPGICLHRRPAGKTSGLQRGLRTNPAWSPGELLPIRIDSIGLEKLMAQDKPAPCFPIVLLSRQTDTRQTDWHTARYAYV